MSDLKLALAYLRSRPLVTILTVISVSLGLSLATIVLVVARQAMDTLNNEAAYWDMVVGAKGSKLQIVLNGLYYLDAPTGNIDISIWDRLRKDKRVDKVAVVNMGDSYYGAPIVGTTPDFLTDQARKGDKLLAQGRLFEKPMEVVIGAEVARFHRNTLGQQICGSHGWGGSDDIHKNCPYTVVGILAPRGTSVDRAVYADYHSVWEVHKHPDADEAASAPAHKPESEVTAVLVHLKQAGNGFVMEREINANWNAMAARPADVITDLLDRFIAPLQKVILAIAYLVVLVSALSILISLYLTIHQRRRDMAILRSLGATQGDVFRLITLEAAALAGIGVLLGWVVGHALLAAGAPVALSRFGIGINAWQVQPVEFKIMLSVWILGVFAGLLPAAIAYQLPVAETLQKE